MGSSFFAKQVEDGRDDIERTRDPSVTRYHTKTFDEEETIFARVASGATIGHWTDRPEPRMAQATPQRREHRNIHNTSISPKTIYLNTTSRQQENPHQP